MLRVLLPHLGGLAPLRQPGASQVLAARGQPNLTVRTQGRDHDGHRDDVDTILEDLWGSVDLEAPLQAVPLRLSGSCQAYLPFTWASDQKIMLCTSFCWLTGSRAM